MFTNINRMLAVSIVWLVTVFVFFETTDADLWVQDHFYDFGTHSWAIDAKSALPRALCYTGPKILIWCIGLALAGMLVVPTHSTIRKMMPDWRRKDILVAVATLAIAPASIATLKAVTNVHTPSEIRRYGGFAPYVKVCESYPSEDRPARRGRGFPAGHASGGFALMALAGLARSRRTGMACLIGGLATGSILGAYQMLKGAHYLSHTVISALLCWIIFLMLRKWLGCKCERS